MATPHNQWHDEGAAIVTDGRAVEGGGAEQAHVAKNGRKLLYEYADRANSRPGGETRAHLIAAERLLMSRIESRIERCPATSQRDRGRPRPPGILPGGLWDELRVFRFHSSLMILNERGRCVPYY